MAGPGAAGRDAPAWRRSLAPQDLADVRRRVEAAGRHRVRPTDAPQRWQPVSTLYVPADRFEDDTVVAAGRTAARLLALHAPGDADVAEIFALPAPLAARTRARVAARLEHTPLDDVRVDFEDGYGEPVDDMEDADAVRTARAIVHCAQAGTLPRRWGLRVKSFADGRAERSVRTLDLFLTAVLDTAGALPDGFVVTFPKIVDPEHVRAFADVLRRLERMLGLPALSLRFEAQIETPESVVDPDGVMAVRRLLDRGQGRLAAAHIGVFDYTAALGIPPAEQALDHPAVDFARSVLQVSLAGTGVELCDGSTNILPADLDDRDAVVRAWQTHAAHVRHGFARGYRQGWDLHPFQLVSRYIAVFAAYLDGVDDHRARVAAWRARATGAAAAVTDVPGRGGRDLLDEPATIAVLEAHLRRAVEAGALEATDVP